MTNRVGVGGKRLLSPEIRGEVGVGALEGSKGGASCNSTASINQWPNGNLELKQTKVAKRVGLATGGSVAILHTSHR